jgi:hypothetical protein
VIRHTQQCSLSAQVKAAAAHVQKLKQNQRKKKLSLTLVERTGLLERKSYKNGQDVKSLQVRGQFGLDLATIAQGQVRR